MLNSFRTDDYAKEPNKDSAKKHLMSMLDAISAPVPFSEFPPLSGKLSSTHSASPIHVTAGIIHIYGSTMPGEAGHWPSQKDGHAQLILSYSVSDNLATKTADHDLMTKYQVNPVLMALRGGLYLFFVSWLILTITYGVGMRCMHGKLVL